MRNLKIDPEFRDKIPPLTEAEYEQLRDNILSDGEVYEPIITWNDIIVDGHNRWRVICENWETLQDKFRTKPMEFADKWAAFDWMYRKQLGRRNLTDENRTYCIGKMFEARKKSVGGNRGNQYTKVAEAQNGPLATGDTAQAIADELNVGRNTVKRSEKFAKGIDAIRDISQEAAEKVLSGASATTKQEIQDFTKMEAEQQLDFVEAIQKGMPTKANRKLRSATKEDRESLAEIEAIVADMRDPNTVPEFTLDSLISEIDVNFEIYISQLRNTILDHSNLLSDIESRNRVKEKLGQMRDMIIKEMESV